MDATANRRGLSFRKFQAVARNIGSDSEGHACGGIIDRRRAARSRKRQPLSTTLVSNLDYSGHAKLLPHRESIIDRAERVPEI